MRSRNSEIGLRLANLDVSDWERTPSKRDPRLNREVRASRGMFIRDIAGVEIVASTGGVGFGSSPWDGQVRGTQGGKRFI